MKQSSDARRWLDWQPPISRKDSGDSQKIDHTPVTPDGLSEDLVRHAENVLRSTGTVIMDLNGVATVGIWTDLDSPSIRGALRILGKEHEPVRYLDADGIPASYKLRQVEGEPVPISVLLAMEAEPEEPWAVRDRMLAEMSWCPSSISWTKPRTTHPAQKMPDLSGADISSAGL